MSTHKRKRPETPDQNTGFSHDLEAMVNALCDEVKALHNEVKFVRMAMTKREKICLAPTYEQTFRSNKVYIHIRDATDHVHLETAAEFKY